MKITYTIDTLTLGDSSEDAEYIELYVTVLSEALSDEYPGSDVEVLTDVNVLIPTDIDGDFDLRDYDEIVENVKLISNRVWETL